LKGFTSRSNDMQVTDILTQTQAQPGGLEGLGGLLNQLGGSGLLDDVLASLGGQGGRGGGLASMPLGDILRMVGKGQW
jgi:hypothetical protein